MTLLLPQENVTAIKKQCQTFFSKDQISSDRNLSTNWETVLFSNCSPSVVAVKKYSQEKSTPQ